MPLGYIPGSHAGLRNTISHRIFGSRKFSRAIEFRILTAWLPDKPVKILDIGAGVGELAIHLALLRHRVTAMDFDYVSLREARSPFVPEIELAGGDATRLPFADASFDLVVSNSALEHFPNDVAAISEMARVVRTNGTVMLTTDTFPASASGWTRKLPLSWRREEIGNSDDLLSDMQRYHKKKCAVVNYYRVEDMRSKFEDQGLHVTDWRYYMNGFISKGIYELHILLKCLDFYNHLSRRLFPIFYPFTFPGRRQSRGYGLAIKATKIRS